MIRKLSPLLVLAVLSAPLPLAAGGPSENHPPERSDRFDDDGFDFEEGGNDEGPFEGRPLPPSFEVLPLSAAARIVEERFSGKLIAARLAPPTPREWHQGVQLVHELRLLTPRRDVLAIRLDARNGRFLEVAGAGLAEARKKKVTKP
ncbi:PepSY domain-containing protein [Paracoccus cavernae]|uniref:PepSY domain-containing protein n=1 Tax=Paracoccus cavernae TaxID=1571207 RepID=UPI0035F48E3E